MGEKLLSHFCLHRTNAVTTFMQCLWQEETVIEGTFWTHLIKNVATWHHQKILGNLSCRLGCRRRRCQGCMVGTSSLRPCACRPFRRDQGSRRGLPCQGRLGGVEGRRLESLHPSALHAYLPSCHRILQNLKLEINLKLGK